MRGFMETQGNRKVWEQRVETGQSSESSRIFFFFFKDGFSRFGGWVLEGGGGDSEPDGVGIRKE